MDTSPPLLLLSEVAARLRCSASTVRNLIHCKKLQAVRLPGRRPWFVPADALAAYVRGEG